MEKLLKNEWNSNWAKVATDIQGIITYFENGGPENEEFLLQQKVKKKSAIGEIW